MNSPIRIPLLFVILWSSAYIAIEFCSSHVEPATFVFLRAIITASILLAITVITKINWPIRDLDFIHCSVVGILIHGVYACGVFAAIHKGIDVGLCALILSLQPMLTVLLSRLFLTETITKRKLIGVLLGLIGVSIVVFHGNTSTAHSFIPNSVQSDSGNDSFAIFLCCIALLAISGATIIQKKYCSETHPAAATCIQYTAAAVFILPIALIFETMQINWNLNFILGLSWLVLFVSIGAMTLLMVLIKQGEAGTVANLFYLVMPLVTLEAWILFGDKITPISFVGMLLCMMGVFTVNYVSSAKNGQTTTFQNRKWVPSYLFRKVGVSKVDYTL